MFSPQVVESNCVLQTVLKASAGPEVTFVVMSFADPYVANVARGTSSRVHALASLEVIGQLDKTLATIYQSQDVPMANVARALYLHLTLPRTPGSETHVLTSAASACRLTWMCASAPYGPNIHPNAAGYEAISGAVIAVLPPSFG